LPQSSLYRLDDARRVRAGDFGLNGQAEELAAQSLRMSQPQGRMRAKSRLVM